MANCNEHFKEFNGKIKLTDFRKKELKKSRKDLRKKVRNWFKENQPENEKPKFDGQGSMSTDTIVNPIPRKIIVEGTEKTILKYDVDDGIYFIGDKSPSDRPSTATYHSWICQAVDGHTSTPPIDKNTCVRTVFSDGHHIDQPIYYKQGNSPELAHKRDGYIKSDPLEYTNWFNDKADETPQLRQLVRYGKSWIDFRHFSNSTKKMPSGLILTILITENLVSRKDRDDIALKETLINIQAKLDASFSCYRPTTPSDENLLEDYKDKEYFLQCLSNFINDSKEALKEKNYKKSTEYWRNHLGDRFPLGDDKDDTSSSSGGLGAIIPPTTKPYRKE
ncbi:cyclic GMP-AMP synthase DncV-like nucleotidyltransferase [Pseudozobellia sp. WGM2]|uniref:cyclic GMP-AMP synthase DncV-like nucleotidyltransferase n=1 Tax=Pseudozobellia sp. WGM2 TaxID=2787625 RepID=UPI001ADF021D|nr:hypothetical protein [Pseudozobellia sp. WGM2]